MDPSGNTPTNEPTPIKVRNADRYKAVILQLQVTEAHQTLGVRMAPDRNNKAELEHFMTIASQWFTAMKAGQITLEAAAFSLEKVVLKKLTYPLVTTTFTDEE